MTLNYKDVLVYAMAQPFKGNIEANPLAAAEAFNDRLGGIEDAGFDLVDDVALNANRHGPFAESYDMDRIAHARQAVLAC